MKVAAALLLLDDDDDDDDDNAAKARQGVVVRVPTVGCRCPAARADNTRALPEKALVVTEYMIAGNEV